MFGANETQPEHLSPQEAVAFPMDLLDTGYPSVEPATGTDIANERSQEQPYQ